MKKVKFIFNGMFAFFPFFQNILFSTTYQVFENWPFYLHQTCLNTMWSVIKLFWTCALFGITRKKLKVFVFTGKVTFFRKLVFLTLIQLLQKWYRNLHNNCLKFFWTNGNASWCRHTQYYEKKQVKVNEKIAFFSKIHINFTSDNEMKLNIAQKISRNNMGCYKIFTKVSDFLKLHSTR